MASSARKRRKRRAAKRRAATPSTPPSARSASNTAGADAAGSELAADASSRSSTARTRRRAEPEGGPPPPWGSFPLVELAVLAGIVTLVVGFFFASGGTQAVVVLVGLLLCSIAGLEVAVREHVGGYRSHTLVLAGVPAVAALGILFVAAPSSFPPVARLGVGALVFAASAWALTTLFQRRSGGYAFRVRRPRKR